MVDDAKCHLPTLQHVLHQMMVDVSQIQEYTFHVVFVCQVFRHPLTSHVRNTRVLIHGEMRVLSDDVLHLNSRLVLVEQNIEACRDCQS